MKCPHGKKIVSGGSCKKCEQNQQCKSRRISNQCVLDEGHSGFHRTGFGYTWHTHQRTVNAARKRAEKASSEESNG